MFFEFALIGTTASGKSALASKLADTLDAFILSLDSLCVYKEINIASAKPQDIKQRKYFGIDLLSINEPFNVALFFKEYQKAKAQAQKEAKPLIIVGGTSFYLKTLMQGLSAFVKESTSAMQNDAIYALMQDIDKEAKIAPNDTYRLRKWLGIYEQTKMIPSKFLASTKKEALIKELPIFELVVDKDLLRQKIAKRTQNMLELGLIQEAKSLFERFDTSLKPLNSIGLKECKSYIDGELSLEELKKLINTHTAQLAKRQRTFNKKFSSIKLEANSALKELEEFLKKMPKN